MTSHKTATRRTFLKGGALLTSPLAAASLVAGPLGPHSTQEDAVRLQDEAAIRVLHHEWLRQINAGNCTAHLAESVRRLTAHHEGAPDRIEIATDRNTATGRFHYSVESEMTLPADSTLAQMAHAQGHGRVRRCENRVLEVRYSRADGAWKIARAALLPV